MVERLGFYSNSLLLGPAGFDAARAIPAAFFVGSGASQFFQVAGRLVGELKAEGVDVSCLQIELEGAKKLLYDPFASFRAMLRSSLASVDPEKYARAVTRVALSFEDGCSCYVGGMAARWSRDIMTNPRRPWHWFTPSYNRDYKRYAHRLELAGREEDARIAWRQAGLNLMARGRKTLSTASRSLDRSDYDYAQFQLNLAVGDFCSAVKCFERAESDINRAKAKTLLETAKCRVTAMVAAQQEGDGLRVSMRDILADLRALADKEPDHDLVSYARLAALGSHDGMVTFLEQASMVFGVSCEDVLNALKKPGCRLFKRIRETLGNDVSILERLTASARRFDEDRQGVGSQKSVG